MKTEQLFYKNAKEKMLEFSGDETCININFMMLGLKPEIINESNIEGANLVINRGIYHFTDSDNYDTYRDCTGKLGMMFALSVYDDDPEVYDRQLVWVPDELKQQLNKYDFITHNGKNVMVVNDITDVKKYNLKRLTFQEILDLYNK